MPSNDILFETDLNPTELQRLSAMAQELMLNKIATLSMQQGDMRTLRIDFDRAENNEQAIWGVAGMLPGRNFLVTPPRP